MVAVQLTVLKTVPSLYPTQQRLEFPGATAIALMKLPELGDGPLIEA
jgi:hypothetical protein